MLINFADRVISKLENVISTAKSAAKVSLIAVGDKPFRADITNIKGERSYTVKIADSQYTIGADTVASIVLDSGAVLETPSMIKINGETKKDSELLSSPLYTALSQAFSRQAAKRAKKTVSK